MMQLRKICKECVLLAKAKGTQAPVSVTHQQLNLHLAQVYVPQNCPTSKSKKQILEYLNYRILDSPYLFPSERCQQMTRSAIQKVFKKMARKAGLPDRYSIHNLRHTCATLLYRLSRFNLRLVQLQLGHSNQTITSV